jgi:hypothetical protein
MPTLYPSAIVSQSGLYGSLAALADDPADPDSDWMTVTEQTGTVWYVRPKGGTYGAENGTSYDDAWDGLPAVVWGGSGIQPGDTLYVCGLHTHTMASWATNGALLTPISGTADARVTIRGNYPGDPGTIWGHYHPAYATYTNVGDDTYSFVLTGYSDYDYWFQDVQSTPVMLVRAATLDECRATPGSYYSATYLSGATYYAHLTDGGSPATRLWVPAYGYRFNLASLSYITFRSLDMYGFQAGAAGYHHMRWDDCTLMYAQGNVLAFFEGAHYMEVLDCEIGFGSNGIYTIHSYDENAPSYCTFRGNYIHDIGTRPKSYNGDAHAVGIQGGTGNLIEDNYCDNCGTSIMLYAYASQTLTNTIVRGNLVTNPHNLGNNPKYGISTQCDNDSLLDKSGNIFENNIVVGATWGGRSQFEWDVLYQHNVFIDCGIGLGGSRSILANAIYQRAATKPTKPPNDAAPVPDGWYTNVGDVPAGADPLWASQGIFASNIWAWLEPVELAGGVVPDFFDPNGGAFGPKITGRNNIFVNCPQAINVATSAATGFTWMKADGNLYDDCNEWRVHGSSSFTFANWQARTNTYSTFDPNGIEADPLFVGSGDYHLQASSPAIDAGITSTATVDRDGNARPSGDGYDIGAYEYQA